MYQEMKKVLLGLITFLIAFADASGQVPQAINYQAILRTGNGMELVNKDVNLRISILQGSINGPSIYQEIHNPVTNFMGLITVAIGNGTPITGDFEAIQWGIAEHYLKIEVDTTDGTNYLDFGTTQLLSVPYALYAKDVSTVTGSDLDHWNAAYSWGNHATAGYLTSFTESDPIFGSSPAHGISTTNIANWSTAYGWGNHAAAGYLTSYTETDPVWLSQKAGYQMHNDTATWDATRHWVEAKGYITGYTEIDTGYWYRTGTNLTLKNSGDNVGIGISPTTKLDVNGDVRMNSNVILPGITQGGVNDTLILALNPVTRQVYYKNAGTLGGGEAGGEANTASNLGSGTGVYEQKTGVDLQFNSLTSTNSILSISENDAADEINFTVLQSNINHNGLLNFVPQKHFFQKNIDTVNTSLNGLLKSTSGKLSIVTDNSANWNTAYGWGNHALAGYLTSEADPQVGSNSLNYLSKWNGTALVSSSVFESGAGKVGIGTQSPTEKLEVSGKIRADEGFNSNGSDGTSDTINMITEFDFTNSKLKYRTSIMSGGITTHVSPESEWLDAVGDPILEFVECGDPLYDARDGQSYTTVLIGTQCWMAENLDIGTRVNGTVTMTNNSIIEKYCYNNDNANCLVYGGLYQWDEVMAYSEYPGAQGICPVDWHIPMDAEWCTLSEYLDSDANCTIVGTSSYTAGGMMKETGTAHWFPPNTGATNESGFTGLPSGYLSFSSQLFYSLGYYTGFWSSSMHIDEAWYRDLIYDNAELYRDSYDKAYGFSVRCIKD
jgi:uncharacterized protein (TIGR02145 family)